MFGPFNNNDAEDKIKSAYYPNNTRQEVCIKNYQMSINPQRLTISYVHSKSMGVKLNLYAEELTNNVNKLKQPLLPRTD